MTINQGKAIVRVLGGSLKRDRQGWTVCFDGREHFGGPSIRGAVDLAYSLANPKPAVRTASGS